MNHKRLGATTFKKEHMLYVFGGQCDSIERYRSDTWEIILNENIGKQLITGQGLASFASPD